MKNAKRVLKFKNLILPLTALFCWVASGIAVYFQDSLESIYSASINKTAIQALSSLTGILSFSLGEVIVLIHALMLIVVVVIFVRRLFKGGWLSRVNKVIQYVSVLYIIFMLLWGFNYSRMSIGEMMSLSVRPYSYTELENLTGALIEDANDLRGKVPESSDGLFYLPGGYEYAFDNAQTGYTSASQSVPKLSGNYGKPKSIKLSNIMLYTGITGVYFPYTGEANVNTAIPDLLLPATVLHEMAHQRGFAPEDEANFIAYITAASHSDPIFQYSGTMLALIYSINALYEVSPERAYEQMKKYSPGITKDLDYYREFWKPYKGTVTKSATRINDIYLKSNREEDGVASYGRMVDWLIAYRESEVAG